MPSQFHDFSALISYFLFSSFRNTFNSCLQFAHLLGDCRLPDCSNYIYCLPSILFISFSPTPIFASSWVVSPVYARFSLKVVRFCYATTRRLVCKQCPVWAGGHGMMIYHMIWYVEINMLYEITMGNCNVVSLQIELPYVLYHAGGSTSCSLMKVHFN